MLSRCSVKHGRMLTVLYSTQPTYLILRMSSSSSSMLNLVPTFTGENWAAFSEAMEAYLLATGRWWVIVVRRSDVDRPAPVAPPPAAVQAGGGTATTAPQTAPLPDSDDEGAEVTGVSAGGLSSGSRLAAGKEKADWDEANMVVLGTLRLKVAATFRQMMKSQPSAGAAWEDLRTRYGEPTIAAIYREFKAALNVQIKQGVHPAAAIAEVERHFSILAEHGFDIPQFIQAMLLLSRLPPSYDVLTQIASVGQNADELDVGKVRQSIIAAFEGKNATGKGKDKADKATAIKRKRDQGNPQFQQQQQSSQRQSGSSGGGSHAQGQGEPSSSGKKKGKKTSRGKRAGKAHQAKAADGTSHIANVAKEAGPASKRDLRMHAPVPQPPSASYHTTFPELASAIRLANQIGVPHTVETLRTLMDVPDVPEVDAQGNLQLDANLVRALLREPTRPGSPSFDAVPPLLDQIEDRRIDPILDEEDLLTRVAETDLASRQGMFDGTPGFMPASWKRRFMPIDTLGLNEITTPLQLRARSQYGASELVPLDEATPVSIFGEDADGDVSMGESPFGDLFSESEAEAEVRVPKKRRMNRPPKLRKQADGTFKLVPRQPHPDWVAPAASTSAPVDWDEFFKDSDSQVDHLFGNLPAKYAASPLTAVPLANAPSLAADIHVFPPAYTAVMYTCSEANVVATSNASLSARSIAACSSCKGQSAISGEHWIADTGASKHYTNSLDGMIAYGEIHGETVETASGFEKVHGVGTLLADMPRWEGDYNPVRLYPVYYAPTFRSRLLSIGYLLNNGCTMRGNSDKVSIYQGDSKEPYWFFTIARNCLKAVIAALLVRRRTTQALDE